MRDSKGRHNKMKPYIVRFVASGRGKGKTFIASQVVSRLKARGYIVAVIKHVHGDVDIADKDSAVYRSSGADLVLLSTRNYGTLFINRWVDDLEHIVKFANAPIIVVEGYRESEVGEAVVVGDTVNEVEEMLKIVKSVVAAVVKEEPLSATDEKLKNVQLFTHKSVDSLAEFIEARAFSYLLSQTPRTNCGMCGYSTCEALVKAFMIGKSGWCPVASNVRLVIDGRLVPLNPFVKNVLRSTVEGFLSALKGVSENRKKIIIEIEY